MKPGQVIYTSAPMLHQIKGELFDKCGDCSQFAPGNPGGLGICLPGIIRTHTAADGFVSQMLPYPNQIACEQFKPKTTEDKK